MNFLATAVVAVARRLLPKNYKKKRDKVSREKLNKSSSSGKREKRKNSRSQKCYKIPFALSSVASSLVAAGELLLNS